MPRTAKEDFDEDLPDTPTISEQRRMLADAGDVDAVWDILSNTSWNLLDLEKMFQLLLRGLDVAGRTDPAGLSEKLFRRMMSFSGGLVLRSQYYIGRILAGHDRSTTGRAAFFLPRDLTSEHLEQVLMLQTHLVQLMEAQARTARLWGLAHRRLGTSPRNHQEQEECSSGRRDHASNGSERGRSPVHGRDEYIGNLRGI